jgi:hypothetical protein
MRGARIGAVLVAGMMMMPGLASADPLVGRVTDAITGVPIPGAQIEVMGAGVMTQTDALGRWEVELPPGQYEIGLKMSVAGEVQESRLVNQYVPQIKPAEAHFYSTHFQDMGAPPLAQPFGLPAGSGRLPVDAPQSLPLTPQLEPQGWRANGLTLPMPLPRKIRVGRRVNPTSGCSGGVMAIEELDLDEYTRGVLPPEIGVFRSLSGVSEVYKTFALAAKSYGLYFMITYGENNRRTVPNALPPNNFTWFHIDDTACNQRYSDERLTITTNAADAVLNKILVKKGSPDTLDKLEYAASCAKHGTLPEYGSVSNLVPDVPQNRPCVGSWCGHDTCAGHEDNPNVAGTDRCLVRGVCQWGAAGHGIDGRDYLWMVAHYQPNLEIRDLTQVQPATVVVTGYVYTDPANITGTGVRSAEVKLSTGDTTTTDAQGKFEFGGVELSVGTVGLTASAPGYKTAMREKLLEEGVANWASIQLELDGAQPPQDMGVDPGMDPEPMADMGGAQPDMGVDTPDLSGSGGGDMSGLPPADRFGPLITESPGIDGGCAAGGAGGQAGGAAWLLLGALVGLVRRRR